MNGYKTRFLMGALLAGISVGACDKNAPKPSDKPEDKAAPADAAKTTPQEVKADVEPDEAKADEAKADEAKADDEEGGW